MAIEGRLRQLEQTLAASGEAESCPECSGRLSVMFADDPEPTPCAACGREPIVLQLTFDQPHDDPLDLGAEGSRQPA